MGQEEEIKKEKVERLNAYDMRISDIRHSVGNLYPLIYELNESINQFNKESSKYSERLYYLTIALAVLAGIQIIVAIY